MMKGTESSLPIQCCNIQYSKKKESSKNSVTRKSHVLHQIPLCSISLSRRKGAEKYPSGEILLHATLHTVTSVGPFAESFVIGLLLFDLTDQFLTLSLSLSLSDLYVLHRFLYFLYVN
jgi:hypothetical protein